MDNENMNSINERELTDILKVEGVNSKGYGIIPKLVMQDARISTDAKCIYAYFCSYAGAGSQAFPSVALILNHLGMSRSTYYKHLNLLKEFGYLKTQQIKQKGKFSRTIYTLCTNPVPFTKESIQNNKNKTEIETEKSPCTKFQYTEKPYTKFQHTKSSHTEIQYNNINSNIKLTDINNNNNRNNSILKLTENKENNLSINYEQNVSKENDGLIDKSLEENKSLQEHKPEVAVTEEKISQDNKQFIKDLIQYSHEIIQEQLDLKSLDPDEKMYPELTELIYDVVNDKSDYIRVNGAETSGDMVRQRFLKLKSIHLEYVVGNFKQQKRKIKNIRSYLITALYNSYISVSSSYINNELKDKNPGDSDLKYLQKNLLAQKNKSAPVNMNNFEQREYDDEYFDSLYANT